MSSETVSTVGEQRRHNYALKPMNRNEFIRLVTADQPEAPAYFAYDAKLNREMRQTLPKSLKKSLKALSHPQTLKLQRAGRKQLADLQGGISAWEAERDAAKA